MSRIAVAGVPPGRPSVGQPHQPALRRPLTPLTGLSDSGREGDRFALAVKCQTATNLKDELDTLRRLALQERRLRFQGFLRTFLETGDLRQHGALRL